MPSKPTKQKAVVWASGRGGSGNIHKTKDSASKKRLVDPDLVRQPKQLEVETARDRATAGGRGGTGNIFHHVIEPGVFQRVIQHEAARIVAHKAEQQADKVLKQEGRKRSKSTTPYDDTPSSSRPSTRLSSASTSTFATSVSGSSFNTPSSSSYHRYTSSSYTPSLLSSSTSSGESMTERFFSPIKKRFLGLRLDTVDSRSSIDNSELCTPTTHHDNQDVTPEAASPWRIPSLDSPTNGISIDDEPIPKPRPPPTTNSPIGSTFISPRPPPPTVRGDVVELNGVRTSSRVTPVEASRNYYDRRVVHDKSQNEGRGVYGRFIFTQSSIDLSAPRPEMYEGTGDPRGLTVDDTTLSTFGRGPSGGRKGRYVGVADNQGRKVASPPPSFKAYHVPEPTNIGRHNYIAMDGRYPLNNRGDENVIFI